MLYLHGAGRYEICIYLRWAVLCSILAICIWLNMGVTTVRFLATFKRVTRERTQFDSRVIVASSWESALLKTEPLLIHLGIVALNDKCSDDTSETHLIKLEREH